MKSQSKKSIMEMATEYPKVITAGTEEMHWKNFGLQKQRNGLLQNLLHFITKSFIPLKAALKKWENIASYYWWVLSQNSTNYVTVIIISHSLVCIGLNYSFFITTK